MMPTLATKYNRRSKRCAASLAASKIKEIAEQESSYDNQGHILIRDNMNEKENIPREEPVFLDPDRLIHRHQPTHSPPSLSLGSSTIDALESLSSGDYWRSGLASIDSMISSSPEKEDLSIVDIDWNDRCRHRGKGGLFHNPLPLETWEDSSMEDIPKINQEKRRHKLLENNPTINQEKLRQKSPENTPEIYRRKPRRKQRKKHPLIYRKVVQHKSFGNHSEFKREKRRRKRLVNSNGKRQPSWFTEQRILCSTPPYSPLDGQKLSFTPFADIPITPNCAYQYGDSPIASTKVSISPFGGLRMTPTYMYKYRDSPITFTKLAFTPVADVPVTPSHVYQYNAPVAAVARSASDKRNRPAVARRLRL